MQAPASFSAGRQDLGTDLHAPLGQGRPTGPKRPRRPVAPVLLAIVAIAAVISLSVYVLRPDPALRQIASADDKPKTSPTTTTTPAATQNGRPAKPLPQSGMQQSDPNSGANVQRTMTADGSVVTTYSPRQRDGQGPVLIDAQRNGQDPRVADRPNDALLEDSPQGRLPIIGPDGLRPMDQYARPWSGARGTRIAIVVGGLGLSQTGTQRAIRLLPAGVTLAFAATGNSLQRWMQEARRGGHELLVQVPFEPFDYPANNPGRDTLLVNSSESQNLTRLHSAMATITNYTGIMNYQGGRYLADQKALEPVLRDVDQRGLLFLDDGTSAQSKTGVIADAINLPHAFADVTLDSQLQQDAILKKLDELERIADRKGSAIGVASAFDESVDAIVQWIREAQSRGIEIVGVAALAGDSNQQ